MYTMHYLARAKPDEDERTLKVIGFGLQPSICRSVMYSLGAKDNCRKRAASPLEITEGE